MRGCTCLTLRPGRCWPRCPGAGLLYLVGAPSEPPSENTFVWFHVLPRAVGATFALERPSSSSSTSICMTITSFSAGGASPITKYMCSSGLLVPQMTSKRAILLHDCMTAKCSGRCSMLSSYRPSFSPQKVICGKIEDAIWSALSHAKIVLQGKRPCAP